MVNSENSFLLYYTCPDFFVRSKQFFVLYMYYPCPDFFVLYEVYEEKLEVTNVQ